jgi:flagellin-specific chaperone FliS
MTQEEIEALMNGTILDEESSSDDVPSEAAQDSSEESIDDLISQIDSGNTDDELSLDVTAEESLDIDSMLAGIDGIEDSEDEEDSSNAFESQDIDSILASIDGVVDDIPEKKEVQVEESDDLDAKIERGIYPMPVEKEHKVVNQLSQVAEDSEAKASQIFDVLSFILDENDIIGRNISSSHDFINSQITLLERLAQKFPNIDVFTEQLLKAQEAKTGLDAIETIINDENGKLFEAMELMQFHDINRQKIERVMAVIRKLSNYLNGIFEDDSTKPEVQIAKHISGDSNTTVTADDLDDLIAQYSQD